MLAIPFIIFIYLFASIVTLEQKAPLLVLSIFIMIFLSNIVAVSTSYGLGQIFFALIDFSKYGNIEPLSNIEPLFKFPIPQIITSEWGLIAGLTLGLLGNYFSKGKEEGHKLRSGVTKGLNRFFIPLLPLYIFGFVLKMDAEGSLRSVIHNLGFIFVIILAGNLVYTAVLYFVAAKFNLKKAFYFLIELLPAAITGFSTMSSAAAMPLTIQASEKNTKNKEFADLIVPSSVNIHLLGDAIGVPIMGMAMLLIAGQPIPDIVTFFIFTISFALAKFSSVGIPGGGVIVLLPILQQHLGLSAEMTSLLATFYILQDPMFTGFNVMGNGAFAIVAHNILKKSFMKKQKPQHEVMSS